MRTAGVTLTCRSHISPRRLSQRIDQHIHLREIHYFSLALPTNTIRNEIDGITLNKFYFDVSQRQTATERFFHWLSGDLYTQMSNSTLFWFSFCDWIRCCAYACAILRIEHFVFQNTFTYLKWAKMGKPQRRRKVHFGDTHLQRRWRTRNRKRDLDMVSLISSWSLCDVTLKHSINFIVRLADWWRPQE